MIVRSHLIHILSKNKSPEDTNYLYSIEIPDNLIKVDNPALQVIKLTLIDFTMPFSFTLINSSLGNNSITFFDSVSTLSTTITIPDGNWSYYNLAAFLTDNYENLKCIWQRDTNKLYFSFTNLTTISFTADSAATFGFFPSDTGLVGSNITSTNTLMEDSLNNIYISLIDILLGNDGVNLDNISGSFRASNLLSCIPVVESPWTTIKFQNGSYANNFTVTINNEKLNRFTLALLDNNGNYLTQLPNWEMIIKIDVCERNDKMFDAIQNISQQVTQLMAIQWLSHKQTESQYLDDQK